MAGLAAVSRITGEEDVKIGLIMEGKTIEYILCYAAKVRKAPRWCLLAPHEGAPR
jgi:hypothetical protein